MADTTNSLGFQRPPNHPEGDASQCPFMFLQLMQMKARQNPQYVGVMCFLIPRPMPPLIINSSSSSGEEESDSEDLPPVLGNPTVGPSRYQPKFQAENPWYDPALEKLLDEAFPMTEEEKASAGAMLCPTMIFQRLVQMKVQVWPEIPNLPH